ncbi:hypothetical protein ISG33_14505 [Glaciecola sp. MH2013]|uniref:hypothetical protein n=1 Tax=Glaciecola sp. MH2013 TaxID=2785524 RepID=UPI00189D737C|nr:hypothetical protein [Glaciecola sp. MH2013]MBF7074614.1 hypothetical protein [Glaciecola sp. MH2013]
MDKNLPKTLFDALALYSLPLERVFHLALETIKTDESISDKYRDELLTSVKAVLFNSLEIHTYIQSKDSTLDFSKDGKIEYEAIRDEFRSKFPSDEDREVNLHLFIEEESERRMEVDKKPSA